METQIVKLADINPAPYNPRKLLQKGDAEYEALHNSIQKFGLVEPLVVNKRTGNLVGGHQRMNVLLAQGKTEAEAVIVDVSEEQERLLNIALNKIEGEWDYEKLDALFQTMDVNDIKFAGFSQDEVGDLFGSEEPLYSDEEPNTDEQTDGGEIEAPAASEKASDGFRVYLSFPTRASAVGWLMERHLDSDFDDSRSITVRMAGTEYDRED